MGPDGFGRWDVLIPSFIFIDLNEWGETSRFSDADGVNDTVYVAHAPNHRGFKGTEFVCKAVEDLRGEGLKVELLLIEKMQNSEVKRVLAKEADILVEALVCTGHGLNGLEGMATGLPVITNLEDDSYTEAFRTWSYLDECPILSASPENIKERLRDLIINPSLRHDLGKASRQYVEKYQGFDSSFYLFSSVINYVYGDKDSISFLYHPIFSTHSKRMPYVSHPLLKNRFL
jgi:glycosyltransferase involved in cell wall biosynthesis